MMEQPTFTVYQSKRRMIFLIILLSTLSLTMVLVDFSSLLSGLIEGSSSRRSGTLAMLLSILPWVGAVGIIGALMSLPKLFRKTVEIEISDQGLFYPNASKEILPWDRVEKIAERTMLMFPVLAVEIKDAESFPLKPIARKTAELNRMAGGELVDITIETMRIDCDFDALVEAVNKYVEVERLQ